MIKERILQLADKKDLTNVIFLILFSLSFVLSLLIFLTLTGNLSNLKEIDNKRMEQEIFYFIEKLDINEEMVRLKSNLKYFEKIINEKAPNGKKLTFISQEIGREINTLGSKANDEKIQKIVVEMKDELEKIKEQLLNVL